MIWAKYGQVTKDPERLLENQDPPGKHSLGWFTWRNNYRNNQETICFHGFTHAFLVYYKCLKSFTCFLSVNSRFPAKPSLQFWNHMDHMDTSYHWAGRGNRYHLHRIGMAHYCKLSNFAASGLLPNLTRLYWMLSYVVLRAVWSADLCLRSWMTIMCIGQVRRGSHVQ